MTSVLSPQTLLFSALAALLLASPAPAQEGRAPETQKPKATLAKPASDKPNAEKAADSDASRFCASVGPSIVEARVAWQTKRLAELDAQVRQRISDLEKAEIAARDWIARRESLMAAANDDLVAIYAKMQAEVAARQLSAMDERIAAAILAKLKPGAASAILDEMESERANRLVGLLSAGDGAGKKS